MIPPNLKHQLSITKQILITNCFKISFVHFLYCLFIVSWLLVIKPFPAHASSLTVSLSVGNTYFSVNGYTSPAATIAVKENGAIVATGSADNAGFFTLTFLSDDGLHTFDIYATDVDGVQTSTIIQTVSLTAGSTTTLGNLVLPPTLSYQTVETSQGTIVRLHGMGYPNSQILIFSEGTLLVTVNIDSLGRWNAEINPGQLIPGVYALTLRNSLSSGYTSLDSISQTVTLLPGTSTSNPSPATTSASPDTLSPPTPLPWWLSFFDFDHNLRLSLSELINILTTWVSDWTNPSDDSRCDLNQDTRCNLIDLSILLYYIER